MADLLSHLLVAYVVLTVASWWLDWLTPRLVVVGMGGAVVPDLTRIGLVVDPATVQRILGIPFTWGHLATIGGVLLGSAAIAAAFERRWWRRAYAALVVGGLSHLALDGMRVFADGRADQWLFPLLPAWRPPTPNLYVTSDPLVLAVIVAATATVVVVDRRRDGGTRSP